MKIIVFGVGRRYERYKSSIENMYEVQALVDNDSKKWNTTVLAPSALKQYNFDSILVTPKNYSEIVNQIINMGIPKNKILLLDNLVDIFLKHTDVGNYGYYGQHCEDLILASIFKMIGIEKPSYMDIGVNHPVDGNNTYYLYKNGCKGINIEANPLIMGSIAKFRPNDISINIGVAAKSGYLKFYKFGDGSGLNTFSEKEAFEHKGDITDIIELPVTTLTEIVKENCPDIFPNFLDIDIEGLDYEVLSEYDLKKNGPDVICVEVREADIKKFNDLLTKKGYFIFCRIGENNIYVSNKHKKALCHLNN